MGAVWTLPERHLITELAVGLARRLELILGTSGGHKLGLHRAPWTAVLWTNKMAGSMQDTYLWNADGQSIEAVAQDAFKDECAVALNLTPEHTRRLLAAEAKRMSEFDFLLLLKDRFDGLYFKKDPDGALRSRPGDVRLLKAVYRSLRAHW